MQDATSAPSAVRCRFTCQSKTQTKGWDAEHPLLYEIEASVVTDELDPETAEFFAATPAGKLNLQTVVGSAADFFVAGRDYYVTFTPAD